MPWQEPTIVSLTPPPEATKRTTAKIYTEEFLKDLHHALTKGWTSNGRTYRSHEAAYQAANYLKMKMVNNHLMKTTDVSVAVWETDSQKYVFAMTIKSKGTRRAGTR